MINWDKPTIDGTVEPRIRQAQERLERSYVEYLDAFDLRQKLQKELALEEDYWLHVRGILLKGGLSGAVAMYQNPFAFCGGQDAPRTVFGMITGTMPIAAADVGLGAYPVFCGLVPQGNLGTTTDISNAAGGVIRFDVALWFFIRLAAQQVASALATITEDASWGDDGAQSPAPGERLRERLDGYVRLKQGLRDNTFVRVMAGKREQFRRELNLAALIWIVGHEYGHLEERGKGPPPPFGVHTESTETRSNWTENQADAHAHALLLAPTFGIRPLAAVMAPTLVLTLQAFALRTAHKAGLVAQEWTHWAPELRAGIAVEHLAETSAVVRELYPVAQRFRDWIWDALRIEDLFREAAIPDGWARA